MITSVANHVGNRHILWKLDIATARARGVPVLILGGRLGHADSADLEEAMNRCLGDGRSMVIDLSSVDYLSSRCLDVLARAEARSAAGGGRLALAGDAPAVGVALDLANSRAVFVIEPTRDEAVARALDFSP